MKNWDEFIFSNQPFESKAKELFVYQFENNAVYRRFCKALDSDILEHVRNNVDEIPLLPIQAFKDADIITAAKQSALTFKSSGTSDMERSTHYIADEQLYRQSLLKGFSHFYDLEHMVILGYTPGYAENRHSSLIWMINELIKQDEIKKSRFLPLDKPLSQGEVDDIAASGKQLILFGAAFGLIDLAERSSVKLPSNSVIIETGGMKTNHREIERVAMHRLLAEGFGLHQNRIHSEYGMCELLSQAYTTGGKWFKTVPWMKVSIRNPDNPQQLLPPYNNGLIGVMDLANVHSCSFILTGDAGIMDGQGRFQVFGRWNPKDLRGCNFLIDED